MAVAFVDGIEAELRHPKVSRGKASAVSSPKTTIWPLEPHTVGKHRVLKGYLDAWFPIMTKLNKRVLFIDGFAGPGEYHGGEPGSPLVAIATLRNHRALPSITAEVRFFFVESDPARKSHLESVLARDPASVPAVSKVQVIEGTFDGRMTELLDFLDDEKKRLAPAFVMVDRFGISDTPMAVIQRLLSNPCCEVYVSFMYEAINRFKRTSEFEPHLDALFGCESWRDGLHLVEPEARKDFFYGLYANQLRKAGAKHVVHFDLYEGNRLVYAIFFGTQNHIGCDRMKAAIWKVSPWGEFNFRGSNVGQARLGIESPDYRPLVAALKAEFRDSGFVSIVSIERFVMSEQTDFHCGQLRSGALVPMERAGEIEVDPGSRKKARTYPGGTSIRFL